MMTYLRIYVDTLGKQAFGENVEHFLTQKYFFLLIL